MAYLVPPMADETPPEFIAFVVARLGMLRAEVTRLIGGDRSAPEVTMQVLVDLAGHWRGLTWLSRLSHRDAAAEYLDRRLTMRTRQWREEQIYPVEVNVLRDGTWLPPPTQILETAGATPLTYAAQYRRPPAPPGESIAQRLASLLPSTVRRDVESVAEAQIAWVHAYRRYLWRRYCRMGAGFVLLIGAMMQVLAQIFDSN